MKIGEVKQHFNTCSVGQTPFRGIDANVSNGSQAVTGNIEKRQWRGL
jgi:hypothetical protein